MEELYGFDRTDPIAEIAVGSVFLYFSRKTRYINVKKCCKKYMKYGCTKNG